MFYIWYNGAQGSYFILFLGQTFMCWFSQQDPQSAQMAATFNLRQNGDLLMIYLYDEYFKADVVKFLQEVMCIRFKQIQTSRSNEIPTPSTPQLAKILEDLPRFYIRWNIASSLHIVTFFTSAWVVLFLAIKLRDASFE